MVTFQLHHQKSCLSRRSDSLLYTTSGTEDPLRLWVRHALPMTHQLRCYLESLDNLDGELHPCPVLKVVATPVGLMLGFGDGLELDTSLLADLLPQLDPAFVGVAKALPLFLTGTVLLGHHLGPLFSGGGTALSTKNHRTWLLLQKAGALLGTIDLSIPGEEMEKGSGVDDIEVALELGELALLLAKLEDIGRMEVGFEGFLVLEQLVADWPEAAVQVGACEILGRCAVRSDLS